LLCPRKEPKEATGGRKVELGWSCRLEERKKGNGRIRKRREEEQMDFPKDLNTISENCRDLFVKQNFSLI
jgi:hypothetical protein